MQKCAASVPLADSKASQADPAPERAQCHTKHLQHLCDVGQERFSPSGQIFSAGQELLTHPQIGVFKVVFRMTVSQVILMSPGLSPWW